MTRFRTETIKKLDAAFLFINLFYRMSKIWFSLAVRLLERERQFSKFAPGMVNNSTFLRREIRQHYFPAGARYPYLIDVYS